VVDHRNRIRLDNRRSNLRIVSKSFNSQNKPKRGGCTSIYRGVRKKRDAWQAECAGQNLGCYKTQQEAAAVHDGAALRRWGPDAETNGIGAVTTLPIKKAASNLPWGVTKVGLHTYRTLVNFEGVRYAVYRGTNLWAASVAFQTKLWELKYRKLETLVNAPIPRDEHGVAIIKCGNAYSKVDDIDFHRLSLVIWHLSWHSYAESSLGLMHRVLVKGERIDHINNDKLDNRRANLRQITASGNCQNRKRKADNQSGYLGVSRNNTRWFASISFGKQSHFCGNFKTAEEAAHAYDAKALELYDRPSTNFPVHTCAEQDKRQMLLDKFLAANCRDD